MVIIIKRLVPVFSARDKVPSKYLNLKKAVHVTSFKHLYPSIPEILVNEYGLHPDEKIVVFWTREVPRPGFPRYRLPFKKVHSGRLSELEGHFDRIRRWGKGRNQRP